MNVRIRWLLIAVLGVALGVLTGSLVVREQPRVAEYCAFALATVAGLWFFCDWLLHRRGRMPPHRVATFVLLLLGGLGFASSQNWFRGHFRFQAHPTDFIHYYLGARYFDNLRYEHIYTCSLAALQEQNVRLDGWFVRDLTSNSVRRVDQVQDKIAQCPDRFAPDEWLQFKADVVFLAGMSGPRYFQRFVTDHGFNPPPTWIVAAKALLSLTGGTAETAIRLVWVDTAFVAAAALILLYCFGPRAFCLAMVFLGCHTPNRFDWVGGSLLRMDWWFWCMVSIAALSRSRPMMAGAAWAYASLLRIFPLFLGIGPLAADLWRFHQGHAATPIARRPMLRYLLGASATALVLFALTWPLGGMTAWRDFYGNIRKHGETTSFNHVGLQTLLSYNPAFSLSELSTAEGSPVEQRWKQAQYETFKQRRIIHHLLVFASFGALALIAKRVKSKATLASLSLSLVPMATALSSYYMSLLAALAVPGRLCRALAAAMMAAVMMTQALQQLSNRGVIKMDVYFLLLSAVDVALVSFFLGYHLRKVTPPINDA